MIKEKLNEINIDERKQYQLNRAKEYLENKLPKDGSEPRLELCIISDLIRIIENK